MENHLNNNSKFDAKTFGYFILGLGLVLFILACYFYWDLPKSLDAEYFEALSNALARGGYSERLADVKIKIEDYKRIGTWLGISSVTSVFFGIAIIFSNKKSGE